MGGEERGQTGSPPENVVGRQRGRTQECLVSSTQVVGQASGGVRACTLITSHSTDVKSCHGSTHLVP